MSSQLASAAPRVRTSAQLWHALTAVVAGFALVAQLVVAVNGENDTAVTRVIRFVSYFTIQSNWSA
jgi:hypothetical protein